MSDQEINVVANLPAVAQEGELFREQAGGNLYRWKGEGWEFVPETDAAAARVEDSAVGEIAADPVPSPLDPPNAPVITPPEAGAVDSGASERAADTVIDAVTGRSSPQGAGTDANGSEVHDDPPPTETGSSEPEQQSSGPDNGTNESDPPPSQPPRELSEDDVEKLAKKRRKAAQAQLEKDEGK